MKVKCIIVDDEPIARAIIREYLEEIYFMELVGEADSALSAMKTFSLDTLDIIFMDIDMPKINGIDFLKNSTLSAKFIMTTAHAEYAVEAYGLDVLDYLVKPIAFQRFLKSCNKAKEAALLRALPQSLPLSVNDYFFVKCNNQIEKVLYRELVYAEAMLNYVMLHTSSRKMMVYLTIKSLEEQLPPDLFIKVHKSFIVNKDKVKSIEGNVLDVGSHKITISQNLKEKVIDDILKNKMIKR